MSNLYLNNKFFIIKNFVIMLIILALLTANSAFAIQPTNIHNQDYFKIETSPQKYLEVDLSTVEIDNDIITFSAKYNKKDFYQVNTLSINIVDKTAKIIRKEIYDKNGEILDIKEYPNGNKFIVIKEGTLMDELYNVAVILKSSAETFKENPKVWEKYFSEVGNNIYKKYHPNILRWKRITETKNMYIVMMIDKKGNILSYQYQYVKNQKVNYEEFDTKYKEHIEKIFKNDKVLLPLPKEYKGDKIIMRFYFGFDKNSFNKSFKQNYNYKGSGIVEIEKNSSPVLTLPIIVFRTIYFVLYCGIIVAFIPISFFLPTELTDKFYSILK